MSDGSGYQVKLEVFEGPLDLLLHLVQKHELEILNIPVTFITEKYLQYLELLRHLNLEVAGEYILMAATLAHLKSRELLPNPEPLEMEEGEDGDMVDPRQELIRRLLEYQKYKQAAMGLGGMPVLGRNVWARGSSSQATLPEGVKAAAKDGPLAPVPLVRLVEALAAVLEKTKVVTTHDVNIERLSIGDRIHELVDRLESEGSFSFVSCFHVEDEEITGLALRQHVVVTFLAILEMARCSLIKILQFDSGEILVSCAVENVRERAKGMTNTYDPEPETTHAGA